MPADLGDGSSRLADALGREAFLRVADARRAVWSGALAGLAVGTCVGFGAARLLEARRGAPSAAAAGGARAARAAARNRVAVATMAAGAAASFVGALAGGIPRFDALADLWPSRAAGERADVARGAARDSGAARGDALLAALRARAGGGGAPQGA